MIVFGTLGPKGSNHDWVARKYFDHHELSDVQISLFSDFDMAFSQLIGGQLDYVLQVAVHPSVASSIAQYRNRAHLVDTFFSPSQDMAVLTRKDVEQPTTLGLQPATRDYVDTSRWRNLIAEPTTIDVGHGLLTGKYDSGITLLRFAEENPSTLKIDEMIGTVVDPWLVYGREPVASAGLVAWKDAPITAQFRRLLAERRRE